MEKKRSKGDMVAQIARRKRLVKLDIMLLKGTSSQEEMAAAFGVSQSTICQDIKLIKKRWLEADGEKARAKRAKRIKQLELAAQLAITSFERSRNDAEEITTTTRMEACPRCNGRGETTDHDECPHCKGKGEKEMEVTTRKIKGNPGDAAFINTYRDCVKESAKLEALYPRHQAVKRKRSGPSQHLHLHANGQGAYDNVSSATILAAKEALENLKAEARKDVIAIDVEVADE